MNLSTLTDEQLADNIKNNNCSDSVVELERRHRKLVTSISKVYAGASDCTGVSLADFMDESSYLVYQAAKGFDAEKNSKFSTWLANQTRYYCLNTLNKQKKYVSERERNIHGFDLERDTTQTTAEFISNEQTQESSRAAIEFSDNIEYIKNIISQVKDTRIKTIMEMRYFNGTNKKTGFVEISKALNMSTQGVVNLHDDFIFFLREKIRANENMDII